jgi:hypothetical protein
MVEVEKSIKEKLEKIVVVSDNLIEIMGKELPKGNYQILKSLSKDNYEFIIYNEDRRGSIRAECRDGKGFFYRVKIKKWKKLK